jgi:hypothetical protein
MSASMMPTRRRSLRERDRRFTATVVLPTPPLPAPTAMTFFTPGTDWRRRRTDRLAHARAHLHVDAADAGHLHHRGARLIAH